MIPIPDSSRPSALELANTLGKTYREGFVKNRYIGRTFIMPGQAMRKKSVRQKLNPIGMEFKDKVVLLVDDSIVRGTTSREIVQMARDAGARKVYFASASPPVRFPNVYGIDMPNQHELVATGRTEAEIAREIGADLLVYQDLDALKDAVRDGNPRLDRFRGVVLRRQVHHRRHHARLPVAARASSATRRAARRRPIWSRTRAPADIGVEQLSASEVATIHWAAADVLDRSDPIVRCSDPDLRCGIVSMRRFELQLAGA